MDSLIALGASAAVGYGIFAMYRISYGLGHGNMAIVDQYSKDLYFESAGMILTLITVGKYLESRSKGKTSEAITKLMDLSPRTAILLTDDGEEREVPTEELREGDVFLVKPGSLVPVDGTVLEGNSSVDEAAITDLQRQASALAENSDGDKWLLSCYMLPLPWQGGFLLKEKEAGLLEEGHAVKRVRAAYGKFAVSEENPAVYYAGIISVHSIFYLSLFSDLFLQLHGLGRLY